MRNARKWCRQLSRRFFLADLSVKNNSLIKFPWKPANTDAKAWKDIKAIMLRKWEA